MKNAVVIKVNDFTLCDSFYREVLGLGEPETVSSFGSCYNLSPDSRLYLLKSEAPFLEHASSALSWCFSTPDMEALEARLARAGFPLAKEPFRLGYDEYRRGADPEENPFYVREEKI